MGQLDPLLAGSVACSIIGGPAQAHGPTRAERRGAGARGERSTFRQLSPSRVSASFGIVEHVGCRAAAFSRRSTARAWRREFARRFAMRSAAGNSYTVASHRGIPVGSADRPTRGGGCLAIASAVRSDHPRSLPAGGAGVHPGEPDVVRVQARRRRGGRGAGCARVGDRSKISGYLGPRDVDDRRRLRRDRGHGRCRDQARHDRRGSAEDRGHPLRFGRRHGHGDRVAAGAEWDPAAMAEARRRPHGVARRRSADPPAGDLRAGRDQSSAPGRLGANARGCWSGIPRREDSRRQMGFVSRRGGSLRRTEPPSWCYPGLARRATTSSRTQRWWRAKGTAHSSSIGEAMEPAAAASMNSDGGPTATSGRRSRGSSVGPT